MHPRTLVESRCAGGILGVDAKPDSSLAAAIELSEGMAQERKPQPALTPRAQHAERTDPACAGSLGVAAKHRSNLVSLAGDEPKGWVEVGHVHASLGPVLIRLGDEVPFIRERFVEDSVKRRPVAGLEGAHAKTFGPLRRGRLAFVFDEHPVEATNLAIPGALEEFAGIPVRRERPRERRGEAELARALLCLTKEPAAEPEPGLRRMHEAVGLHALAMSDDDGVRSKHVVLDDPRVADQLGQTPPVHQLGLRRVGPALDGGVDCDHQLVDRWSVLDRRRPDAEAFRQGRGHRASQEGATDR